MSDLQLLGRLLGYVGRHRALFVGALALYPLGALSIALPPYLVQQMLDVAVPTQDVNLLHVLGGAYLASLILEYVAGFGSQFAMGMLGQRAVRSLRRDAFSKLQALHAGFFDRNPLGRVLTRVTNDVEALAEMFATGAVTVVGDIVTLLFIVGMMLWLDVRLTLYAFLVVPPLTILAIVFQRFARRAFRAIRRHLARMNAFLSEHLRGMTVVQVFCQQQRTQDEFVELNRAYRDANRQAIAFDAALYSVVEAIGTIAVAALLWYGATELSVGAVGAGTLVAFIQYIRRFFIPIRDLSTKYTVLQSAFASAERVFAFVDEPVHIGEDSAAKPLGKLNQALEFRDVWFAYGEGNGNGNGSGSDGSGSQAPGSARDAVWVLRGLSFRVERGEHVALVGSTGAGKTTILKLLNRFYDVQRGAVLIDGKDVRQLRLADVRRLFAVVLQDVYLFSGTVMDNLSLHGLVSEEGVRRAVAAIGLESFIEGLPRGYRTPVQEYAANFSAGERQLLALARALALDPEILVLDEATSNVDSETEARIQQALDVLLRGRTALVVAHRLSTIRKVDSIVVLEHGQVIQRGDHNALMAEGGVYKDLVELHAL